MALRGKIKNCDSESFTEQVITECECGLEKIVVSKYKGEKHYSEDDLIFLELIHYPENIKKRWSDFVKGRASHEVILSKNEFLDFLEKLNEFAENLKENKIV